jgi:hypothetical protein
MTKQAADKSSAKPLPKKGAKVSWQTSQGPTTGTVERVATSTTRVKGYTAKATPEHPEVVVRSEKSGKVAVHKPGSLKRA